MSATICCDLPGLRKTKKKKTALSEIDKDKLWTIFDKDRHDIETVYDTSIDGHCQLCQAQLMLMDDGFPTCTNTQCGWMFRDVLDYSPEWRFFGADDKNANDPTRCGNPVNPLLAESSFGCKVLCNPRSSYEMKKISKWTSWQSMPHKEKSLYDEFQFITTMAQNAGIPKIFIDDAMSIHKDISEQQMFRGLNRDGIKSASIYISCRMNGCPRTAHELCLTKPSSFIDRYCSLLCVNTELSLLSRFIAQKIEQKNIITDNTPHSVAAGIVFFVSQVCGLNISKKDIHHKCGVSEVTINKCYKKMDSIRGELIPQCILDKYQ